MKTSIRVVAMLALMAVLIADTEGGWLRRVFGRCRFTCGVRCGFGGCRVYCGLRCSGKRSVPDKNAVERPLPADFKLYDHDNDGQITLTEFCQTLGTSEQETRKVFQMFDKDGSKTLDKIEFEITPWVRNSNMFDLHLRNSEDLKELLDDAEKEARLEGGHPDQPGSGDDSLEDEGDMKGKEDAQGDDGEDGGGPRK